MPGSALRSIPVAIALLAATALIAAGIIGTGTAPRGVRRIHSQPTLVRPGRNGALQLSGHGQRTVCPKGAGMQGAHPASAQGARASAVSDDPGPRSVRSLAKLAEGA